MFLKFPNLLKYCPIAPIIPIIPITPITPIGPTLSHFTFALCSLLYHLPSTPLILLNFAFSILHFEFNNVSLKD